MATTVASSWVELGKSFKCVIDWVADGSGNASVALPNTAGLLLYSVETNPGSGSDEAYDVTIPDAEGTDVLDGSCTGRSYTANEIVFPTAVVSPGALTFTITGAKATTGDGRAIVMFLMNK